MRFRLRIEDRAQPKDVRFLTVLQGADARRLARRRDAACAAAGDAYEGAVVAGTAVLFPVEHRRARAGHDDRACRRRRADPRHRARAGRGVRGRQGLADASRVAKGGGAKADEGGVLVVE